MRCDAIVMCPQPVGRRHAPAVSGHKARKAILGYRGGQIIADAALVLEEFSGHHCAYGVAAQVFRSAGAASVSVETGERVGATWLKFAAEHISIGHPSSIGVGGSRDKARMLPWMY